MTKASSTAGLASLHAGITDFQATTVTVGEIRSILAGHQVNANVNGGERFICTCSWQGEDFLAHQAVAVRQAFYYSKEA